MASRDTKEDRRNWNLKSLLFDIVFIEKHHLRIKGKTSYIFNQLPAYFHAAFFFTQHRSFLWSRSWKDDSYTVTLLPWLPWTMREFFSNGNGWKKEGRKERGLPQKQASRRRRRCFQRNNKGRDPFMQVPREYNSAAAADSKWGEMVDFHSFMCFPPFLSRTLLYFSAVPDVLDKLFSQVYQLLTGQGVRQIKKNLGTSGPKKHCLLFRNNAGRGYQAYQLITQFSY